MNLKISIIVPIYNVEDYINRCLSSIVNQTYQPFECIMVDDCSNDRSSELCSQFISSYKGGINMIYLHHERNRGLSAARNTGTDKAKGDYILYIDSDDELPLDSIENMVAVAEKYPNSELIQGKTKSIPYNEYYNTDIYDNINFVNDSEWIKNSFFYSPDSKQLPVNAWNKLLKRDFIIKNKLFFGEGLINEDQLWMFYVINTLKNMSFVHHDTYIHYTRPNSIMTNMKSSWDTRSLGRILNEVMDNISRYGDERQLLFYLRIFFAERHNLKALDLYNLLSKKICKQLVKHKFYKHAYLFHRMFFSKTQHTRLLYEDKLVSMIEKHTEYTLTEIIEFELAAQRVKWSVGKRLFHN